MSNHSISSPATTLNYVDLWTCDERAMVVVVVVGVDTTLSILCKSSNNGQCTDPKYNLQSAQTIFNCTAQDSSLLYSIAHPNINLVIMLKVLGSQWSANDSCILSHLYFQFYLWVVLKHVQNIKKNSYSPVGLVWPNTEELISRPFSGLYKIRLLLRDRMRTKNLRN